VLAKEPKKGSCGLSHSANVAGAKGQNRELLELFTLLSGNTMVNGLAEDVVRENYGFLHS
jgi:hypothetical protein